MFCSQDGILQNMLSINVLVLLVVVKEEKFVVQNNLMRVHPKNCMNCNCCILGDQDKSHQVKNVFHDSLDNF